MDKKLVAVISVLIVLILIFVVKPTNNKELTGEDLLEVVYPILQEDCSYLSGFEYSANENLASDRCPDCNLVSLEDFELGGSGNGNYYSFEEVDGNYFLDVSVLITFSRNTYRGTLDYSFILDNERNVLEKSLDMPLEEYACYNL